MSGFVLILLRRLPRCSCFVLNALYLSILFSIHSHLYLAVLVIIYCVILLCDVLCYVMCCALLLCTVLCYVFFMALCCVVPMSVVLICDCVMVYCFAICACFAYVVWCGVL